MDVGDLLTPWMMLAAVLVPLIFIEGWIHSHLYGVGWLLTNDSKAATYLYYILLFPGVLMHELVQWLISGAIRVETKRIRIWPEPQKDGTLRLDFVQIKDTNPIAASVIGAAPLVVGLTLVWVISNYVLNLNELVDAIGSGSLETIGSAIRTLASKPDFFIWLWLLFAISNAMLPTPTDRQGWPLVIALFVAAIAFLLIIGTGERLEQTYRESVVVGLERLTTAFSTVLVVEIPAVVFIGFSEEILERSTGRKFFYRPPVVEKKRQPGSAEPLEPGAPKPSVYLLDLPIPVPPDKPKPRSAAIRPTAASRSPDAQPGLTSREAPVGTAPARMGGSPVTGDRPAVTGRPQPGSPDRPSQRGDRVPLGGARATGEQPAATGRPQPGSPDRPSQRGDRAPLGGARATGEQPAATGRPQPGSPDRPSQRGDRVPLGGARATGEQPVAPERPGPTARPSFREQQPGGTPSHRTAPNTPVGRPSRATTPFNAKEDDEFEDDLVYEPFDDVDYPDEDDDFYGP